MIQQRLFFFFYLRKLAQFHIDRTLMIVFFLYRVYIESFLTFSFIYWFASLKVHWKNALVRIVNTCSKEFGGKPPGLSDLFNKQVLRKANYFKSDISHPLHVAFQTLPSGSLHSVRVPLAKANRFKFSFVPCFISLFT